MPCLHILYTIYITILNKNHFFAVTLLKAIHHLRTFFLFRSSIMSQLYKLVVKDKNLTAIWWICSHKSLMQNSEIRNKKNIICAFNICCVKKNPIHVIAMHHFRFHCHFKNRNVHFALLTIWNICVILPQCQVSLFKINKVSLDEFFFFFE